jgi:hypothetical protein
VVSILPDPLLVIALSFLNFDSFFNPVGGVMHTPDDDRLAAVSLVCRHWQKLANATPRHLNFTLDVPHYWCRWNGEKSHSRAVVETIWHASGQLRSMRFPDWSDNHGTFFSKVLEHARHFITAVYNVPLLYEDQWAYAHEFVRRSRHLRVMTIRPGSHPRDGYYPSHEGEASLCEIERILRSRNR